ncbi:hypothetical protein C3F09_03140 [candidate division GN15 bacterium]|uniref:PKD/Chitinase domain-containing protein n=1 Tax=candidate division GN15 bacterium TaxID=2072418 RepID=A0A855XB90_9BACT|nr:MAG: hypothetical protein C3F09_03140 [candidate division GN15 bacterium]
MKRLRSLTILASLVILAGLWPAVSSAADAAGSGGVTAVENPSWGPKLILPKDSCFRICAGDSACFDVGGSDPDLGDTLTLTLLQGPISYPATKFPHEFTTRICFTPSGSGLYRFVWQLTDLIGHKAIDTVILSIVYNRPPIADNGSFSQAMCYQFFKRDLQVVASDPDGDALTYELLSGPGTVGLTSGIIHYTPTEAGTYEFAVAVYDTCGVDTAFITDTITLNRPPELTWNDTTIGLCDLSQICLDITASDPEGGPVEISKWGSGEFTLAPITDHSAQLCFTPRDVDTAYYQFELCLKDNCDGQTAGDSAICIVDTVNVKVIINHAPVLYCPPPQSFFACNPDSFCFTVDAVDPDFDPLTFSILSANASITGNRVCIFGNEMTKTDVVIAVADTCGHADTCTVPVEIRPGRPPVVQMPETYDIGLCAPQTVCFTAYVNDPDNDIALIQLNYGSFNRETNQICFEADTSGTYIITMQVTDSCGTVATGSTRATVTINKLPIVQFEKSADTSLCFSGRLCYGLNITDDNLLRVITTYGEYIADSGKVCFTPDTSGTYTIIARAYDDCEMTAEDTLSVYVRVNRPPSVTVADTTLYLCQPREVCLPVQLTDPDGNIKSVTVNRGKYANGAVCFIPYSQGIYPVIVTVTDTCGAVAVDTANVTVQTDQSIVITWPKDTTIFLCQPDTLCFPVIGVPVDAKVKIIGTAAWWDPAQQTVCFYSDCCLQNIITVEVTTACGTVRRGTFTVNVQTNTPPIVILPRDTTIAQCEPSTICLPVGISDRDGNLVTVNAEGATYDSQRGIVCFNPEQDGEYAITVTATDACGAQTSDRMTVTVHRNQPPQISILTADTIYQQCTPTTICLPVQVSDGNLKSVTVSQGTYDPQAGTVCFLPQDSGVYCITATATDSCGSVATAEACVRVIYGSHVSLACPGPMQPIVSCQPETVCVAVPIAGQYNSLELNYGQYRDGMICFLADTTGLYKLTLKATADCNADSCTVEIPVQIFRPAAVSCGQKDTTMLRCALGDTLQFPVTVTGDNVQIEVQPQGAFYANGFVYVPVTSEGAYSISLKAFNACSADSCGFNVTVQLNRPPLVTAGPDTTLVICGEPGPVRIRYTLSDPDNNVVELRSSLGVINDSEIVYTPTQVGVYTVVLTARDGCGLTSTDSTIVTIEQGPSVTMVCPPAVQNLTIPIPDSVHIPLKVMPGDAQVTVEPAGRYDPIAGEVIVFIDREATYDFKVRASALCSTDSCMFRLNVGQYFPPFVECQGSVNIYSCLKTVDTVCMPITISGTNVNVDIQPIGYYDTIKKTVCVPITEAGQFRIQIVAFNDKEADTCFTDLTVTGGRPPVVTAPEPSSVFVCGLSTLEFPIQFSDPDNDIASVATSYGELINRTATSAVVRFTADTVGTYHFAITVTDSCGNTAIDSTQVTVQMNSAPTVNLGEDFSKALCAGDSICVPVTVADVDHNVIDVRATGGQYIPGTNSVCLKPEAEGRYTIIVRATDSCEATGADTVTIDVRFNKPPLIAGLKDTSLYLCQPTSVCLPVQITDPDNDIASVHVNRGTYSNGQICFIPYSQGSYPIIVTVADSCGNVTVDTANCTVTTDQQIVIGFPKDTSIFLCQPDTLCFPVTGVPSDATVRIKGTAAWWDKNKQSVCFFSDCCLQNIITVEVTTACGTVRQGVFTVKVQTNSAPLALLPRDTTIIQCAPTQICLPIGISDVDNNIANVQVTGATYNSQARTACFTPNGEGTFTITVTVTDACGAVGSDQITVIVRQNSRPTITYVPIDTAIYQCQFSEICLPVTVSDPDGNIVNISAIGGTYNAQTGKVCIMPTDTGLNCMSLVATDACGQRDSVKICVTIKGGGGADIQCPAGPIAKVDLCAPGQVCVPLPVTGNRFTVTPSFGTWSFNQLCFQADTTGTYVIKVIASAQCQSDTCVVTVPVEILPAPLITCPGNQTAFLCAPDTLCFNFTTSKSITTVRVTTEGFINGNQICVPVLAPGTKTITLVGSGSCGADTCSFTVTSTFNQPPAVTARDSALTICNLPEICLPFTVTDANNNIKSITTSLGQIKGNTVCYTPPAFGIYNFTITATDSCDATASRTIKLTVTQGASASIQCPDGDQFASICKADSVRVIVPITPTNAQVTVLPAGSYNPATGRVSVWITQSGTYPITVIATAQCGADTCQFNLKVDMGQGPQISCPGNVDTTMCLTSPDTLCLPVTVTGTGVQVVVTPSGYYAAGFACVPINQAGSFYVKITGTGTCGVARCSTLVNVRANQAPVLTLPIVSPIERCPQDTNTVCIYDIIATDAENPVTITKISGPGALTTTSPGHAQVCFVPSTIATYEFVIEATDGCQTVRDTLMVPFIQRPDCDVCVKVDIDAGECTPVGLRKNVDIRVKANTQIAGFDLLMKYDPTAISFQTAYITGSDIQGWEYFTYNLNNANCGGGCPSGLVRFVGLADINNGAHHPPDSTLQPNGILVRVEFQVSNNQNLGGQFVPITFVWYDCGDNTFADPTGNLLYLDNRIYSNESVLIWDENDNANYPESGRLPNVGAPDVCIDPLAKTVPVRCVEFYNGGVCIIHPDSIDDRGDINLNNIAYEVADAVVFTNYFTRGLQAFTINVQGQIAATDVNADGLTLTVADLTLLIRVIIGDASPKPKTVPYTEKMLVTTRQSGGVLTFETEAVDNIGTAWLVCDVDAGLQLGEPKVIGAAQGMDLKYSYENGQLRMLVYNIGRNRIEPGKHDIIEIPYTGEGDLKVQKIDACDYDGRSYVVAAKQLVPSDYVLNQNYPNPFNPDTRISFGLPVAANWTLRIFNLSGALVREYSGLNEAGSVEISWNGMNQQGMPTASGVYFYRLEAGNFSATKKMILLK